MNDWKKKSAAANPTECVKCICKAAVATTAQFLLIFRGAERAPTPSIN